MNDDLVNKSAILELITYVICESEKEIEVNRPLEKVLFDLKGDILSSTGKLSDGKAQNLRYIEQVELAMESDPSIGEITVLRTTAKKSDYKNSPVAAVCFQDDDTVFVQYQGTPESGWVQNAISFGTHISDYMADDGISSQLQADGLDFFDKCVEDFVLNGGAAGLVVGGHSQGGNVAEYVTMMSGYGAKIDLCVALDAPNHSVELAAYVKKNLGANYAKQAGKIVAINGSNDFVNMLGQVSFATVEYYINTNDTWAKENGHGGAWGYHDILYMMDRAKGGLILRKDQVEALEQKKLWNKLPLEEYAGYLAYVPPDEQIAFLGQFPPQQQTELFLLLPIGQQLQLLLPGNLPKQQKDQIFENITPKQKEEMQKQTEQFHKEEEYKKQPQFSAALTHEQMLQEKKKIAHEMVAERKLKNQMKQKLAKVPTEIEDRRQDMFWDTVSFEKCAGFLVYLMAKDQAAFLDMLPPKYREHLQKLMQDEAQLRRWELMPPLEDQFDQWKKRMDQAKGELAEYMRIALQAWVVQRGQTGEQADFGQLMDQIVAAAIGLPKDQMDGSTLAIMGVLEQLLGSKLLADLKNAGLDAKDILNLLTYGLPAVIDALTDDIEFTAEALKGILPGAVKGFLPDFITAGVRYEIFDAIGAGLANALKLVPAPVLSALLRSKPVAWKITQELVFDPLGSYYEDIKDTKTGSAKKAAASPESIYAGEHPYIRVDTDSLRGYAGRIGGIIARLQNRADALGHAIARESAKPEEERDEELIEAYRNMIERLGQGIPAMNRLISSFCVVADNFDSTESRVLNYWT